MRNPQQDNSRSDGYRSLHTKITTRSRSFTIAFTKFGTCSYLHLSVILLVSFLSAFFCRSKVTSRLYRYRGETSRCNEFPEEIEIRINSHHLKFTLLSQQIQCNTAVSCDFLINNIAVI